MGQFTRWGMGALGALAIIFGQVALTSRTPDSINAQTIPPPANHLTPSVPALAGSVGSCAVFPPDHIWNVPVDMLPVHPDSDAYVQAIGETATPHADFGAGLWDGAPIGIPYVVVGGDQIPVTVLFDYADESDPGPYPIPTGAPIEGGPDSSGDRHVLVVDEAMCILYELYAAYPQADGHWQAGSGAVFDLNSYALRPAMWTSADAAGLPILPGLVRYEEVATGRIDHALRFTAPQTRQAYVWPARHFASRITSPGVPAMGQRFRLKADVDISDFSTEVQIILRAMQRYGIILADNGSPWFISGAPDDRWDNDKLRELGRLRGADFEAVEIGSLMVEPDSGQARQLTAPTATAMPVASPVATPGVTPVGIPAPTDPVKVYLPIVTTR